MLVRVVRYASVSFPIFTDTEKVLDQTQSNQNLPEDQCIFIRGFRATRLLGLIPRLRGAAEPTRSPDENEPEPDMHLITTPSSIKVMLRTSRFRTLFDTFQSLRIPLTYSSSISPRWVIYVLIISAQLVLTEVVQEAPNCDMAIVHDDDLSNLICIEGRVCNF